MDDGPTVVEPQPPQENEPEFSIGPYKVIRRIGEGGMGVVYHALQLHPIRRDVALKIIKPGMDSRQVIARFENERQALAVMDHTNIARIFEAGTTDTGLPYFVMEKIDGLPITRYCDSVQLSVRRRVELFIPVCEAIQHAHQKGVIHRDLKPSNVLVAIEDSRATPKVIDFGLAKALGWQLHQETLLTNFATAVGTPQYMSPEQAELGRQDIDTRSDVYSLGAILYELLVGTPPLEPPAGDAGYFAALERIRDVEAVPPSMRLRQSSASEVALRRRSVPAKLRSALRGDLDWIVMKALEKERSRRYETVNGLARDLERYLRDEAVEAGPPSASYRLGKFVAKHRGWISVAVGFVAILTAGVLVSAWMTLRATRAEAEARAISDFLQSDLLSQASAANQAAPDTPPDPNLTVRTALDRAASRIEGKFAEQPTVEASIRHTMGETYYALGLYPEAERQLSRALALRNAALGEAHADSLETMGVLSQALGIQGKYDEAEALDSKALEIERRTLGAEHPQTLESMDNLGSIYRRQGKYAEAEALFTQTLEARRRISGEEDPRTLITMGYLAELYDRQGKYEESEALSAQVLESQRRTLGEEHPATLSSTNRLAVTYFRKGEYARAAELFAGVLAIQRRVLGEEHPDTLTTTSNLATMYTRLGDYALAEPLRTVGLEIQRRVSGDEHPNTLTMIENLGGLYRAQGRYAEAEAVFADNLAARRRVLGPEHPQTLGTLFNLAMTRLLQGNYSLGEPLAEDVLEARERLLGAEHPATIDAVILLSLFQLHQQQYADAEQGARAAMSTIETTSPDDWRRYDASCIRGAALAGQASYAEAEPLLLSGYAGIAARVAALSFENRARLSECGAWIVALYESSGRPAEAARWRQGL